MLQTRLRKGGTNGKYCGILTTNPSHPNHWIYKTFISSEADTAMYSHVDATSIENHFLPDIYINTLKQFKDIDRNYYDRYVLGKWINYEGNIYSNFNPDIHLVDSFELTPVKYKFYRSIDYGFKNPFVCLWIAVDNYKNIIVFDEYYKKNELVTNHINYITHQHTNLFYEATYIDPSASECSANLNRSGIFTIPALNNVIEGIQQVKSYLADSNDDTPTLRISSKCGNLINEFYSYEWDTEKFQKYGKEAPKKTNDHCLDALRYFIHSYNNKKGNITLIKGNLYG